MDSGSRLFFAGPDERRREIARLERAHRRIRGTDDAGRPYTAEDPEVRAWVMLTLYEAMTAMRELSGDPLEPAELDALYAEFKEVCAALGIPDEVLPETAADVPAYVDRTVREVLELGDQVRYLLFEMLREAPAPRRLGRLRPAWPLLCRRRERADQPDRRRPAEGLARAVRDAPHPHRRRPVLDAAPRNASGDDPAAGPPALPPPVRRGRPAATRFPAAHGACAAAPAPHLRLPPGAAGGVLPAGARPDR
ncbi:oxygenase MpaB family protein [Streptomyces goshikiensis]|uniref:oxygenase MpaB family protein n=1 Tax=Streptomyces goshikiensis TaxID=1942 RepID=UPI0036A5E3A4